MFLPRISIKTLFVILAAAAIYSFFISLAIRSQHQWAIGVAATLTMVFAAFLFYSVAFAVAFALAGVVQLVAPRRAVDTTVRPAAVSIVEDE
ncbi:MAG: hypothetical protein QGG36_14840 [Pirellulaceae bacterium]|jgi:predicted phage tail protein|nr:hypothetical protein [Pirellulaceae bacterium]MDP7017080.1 hypothetical protein [Pirellulaceae bacterium]